MVEEIEVTWPYLAKQVDASLQPHLIERNGQEILARAAVHGRLVAFLGAGVSMAYGRLSWKDLVFKILEAVAKLDAGRFSSAPDIQRDIRSRQAMLRDNLGLLRKAEQDGLDAVREKVDELGAGNPLLILQLCSDALQLARDADKPSGPGPNGKWPSQTLDEIYKEALGSPRAHDEELIAGLTAWQKDTSVSGSWCGRAVQDFLIALAEQAQDLTAMPQRSYFLSYLAQIQKAGSMTPRPFSMHDNGHGSPIAALLHDFRVQRFATTNYDNEIEAALAHGLRSARINSRASGNLDDADDRLPADLEYQTLALHLDTASAALAFAVEGRRRHAKVLHLHGQIGDPRRMIASERDYQEQYLRPFKQRDLLDNAIRTLFGANPVLYVGSSISEDDVLRPLRELMSRAPRRSDRLGVALLPARYDEPKLTLQKIESLVRYGIHVIHYGYDGCPRCRDVERQDSWLFRYTVAAQKLKDCINGKEGVQPKHINLPALPQRIDGQGCGHDAKRDGMVARAGDFAIALEHALFEAMVKDLTDGDSLPLTRAAKLGMAQLVDEITSSITTAFLCARLQTESEFRALWARQTTRPLEPVRTGEPIRLRNGSQGQEVDRLVYRHMTLDVGVYRGGRPYRFGSFASTPGDRWDVLTKRVMQHREFRRNSGRRIVLVPVPRGAGKGSMFDQLTGNESAALRQLKDALRPQPADQVAEAEPPEWRTALVSLNFLSDVANVADVIARVVWPRALHSGSELLQDNVYGRMEQSLESCTIAGNSGAKHRVLLALANVGVLFDSKGDPKNGQVLRLLRQLIHPRYSSAPIDFVVFCDEAHVPRRFRTGQRHDHEDVRVAASPGLAWPVALSEDELADQEPRARYEHPNRLMLRGIRTQDDSCKWLHIHPPARDKARVVAEPFLSQWLDGRPGAPGSAAELENVLVDLHRRLGGSRIAMTLMLALCHEQCGLAGWTTGEPEPPPTLLPVLQDAATAMAVHIHETAPETAIHYVFDGWALLHMRRKDLLTRPDVADLLTNKGACSAALKELLAKDGSSLNLWKMSQEILWHLAVFSHPVELSVLSICPGVIGVAAKWIAELQVQHGTVDPQDLIEAVAELCVFRCLAMRIAPRQLGQLAVNPTARRYTVHRMVQRYFIRMMGGRNIEAIEWDQFTTSLYASQPDELPALSADAHARIKGLIGALARYGKSSLLHKDDLLVPRGRTALEEFQSLRAAYFVARSTYSVGVLSHIAAQTNASSPEFGHMEEYRRLIRWITHRAQMLEAPLQHESQQSGGNEYEGNGGFLHRGEIVWLYAECGVMSLTQGKLEDAELLLNLSLRAARRIECDDTGSVHVRLLLHVALVHIERGRPRAAKRVLEQIAARRDGHEMPPLIAEFYLGIIDHLGGEYHSAWQRYNRVLRRFRVLKRTRSAAFVLKSMADLQVARDPGHFGEAEALAEEAVAVAQRGGHEDVRMLAILTLVRIRTKGGATSSNAGAYRQLDLVEKYGVDMGMPRIQAAVHEVRATLLLSQGETNQSAREATSSAEIAALYDLKLFKCKALLTLARILSLRGEAEQAASIIKMGLEMAHAAEYFSCVRGFRALDSSPERGPTAVGTRSDRM